MQERVAAATGISLRTVQRIKQEAKSIEEGVNNTSFSTPNKKRENVKSSIAMDDFDHCLLRRTIHNFHITEKQVPTLQRIYKKMCEDYDYQGSSESLRKEMRKIGFRWRQMKNNRKILMEKQDIRHLRIEFLRKMKKYREEQRPIIYMDETYLHSSHTKKTAWSDESNEGLRSPVSKGTRLIILNAGGEDGFVPNSYVRWKSNNNTGDYHNEMNYENYEKWVTNNLLKYVPPRSVIVIDNAPYHNKQIETCPTSATIKAEMMNWLRAKNIPFNEKSLKPELYNVIKLHKPKYKKYKIDTIINGMGHDVLRLPPYHPDLNPIELVWAAMKEYVSSKNVNFSMKSVMDYCDEFFDQFTVDQWKSRCERAKTFEIEYMAREPTIDKVVEDLIINVGEDDSSSDYEEEEESEGELSGIEEVNDTEDPGPSTSRNY